MENKDTLLKKNPNIYIISAISAENRTIGKENGGLPWHIPEDFKYFKEKTTGHPIIMGRKTFEEFPALLPNRKHIVITRESNYKNKHSDEIIVAPSIEKAIEEAGKIDNEIFIIGGSQIYNLALPYADKLYITLVERKDKQIIDGPIKFPEFEKKFKKVSGTKSSDQNFEYEFTIWERN